MPVVYVVVKKEMQEDSHFDRSGIRYFMSKRWAQWREEEQIEKKFPARVVPLSVRL